MEKVMYVDDVKRKKIVCNEQMGVKLKFIWIGYGWFEGLNDCFLENLDLSDFVTTI